jgi:hypothetical protein
LVASELLSIHIWPASTRSVKFLQVPVLVPGDELLLKHVRLHGGLAELALHVLQHTELLPVFLLELFHLAEQLQLLLVNDLLGFILEGVGLVQLVVPVADLSFFLFAVDLLLKPVDLTLGDVEHVSHFFDSNLACFARVPLFHDSCLDHVAFFCALVLNKSRLLIDEFTLYLLNLLRCLLLSLTILKVSHAAGLLLLALFCGYFFASGAQLGFTLLLVFLVLLLQLFESFWVRFDLALDRLDILLRAPVLEPDEGKDFTHSAE